MTHISPGAANLYAAALALADSCLPVFPCGPAKQPLTANGYRAATLCPVAEDFTGAALIGIPTGELSAIDVVDVDPRHGGDVWLEANRYRLPVTRMQRTQSGGLHIYFRAQPGLRCSASKIAPGVDVRAEGGYIIAWQAAGLETLHADVLADWPDWLAVAAQGPRVRHGENPARSAVDLAPPSVEAVISLLERMPNPEDATRDDYVRVMLAAAGCIQGLGGEGAEEIGEAAIEWACRWHASPGYETEAGKWQDDFATRDAPLAGWQNLLAAAQRFGVDTSAERADGAAGEFAALKTTASAIPAPYTKPALLEFTEDAAALMFADRFAGRFVFDCTAGRWFEYEAATGWMLDERKSVLRVVRGFVRDARAHWGHKQSESGARIAFSSAVKRGCECDDRFAVTSRVWDADPYMLGVPGGSVDLRTGGVHPADAGRFVLRRTTVTPAQPGARPVTWLDFLHDATGGDDALQAWLQRLLGYALTGDVSEEMLAFFYGSGGNGKGVLLHTISTIMGDYAYQAPAELFKADTRINRDYQMAQLDGVRLLLASETESGVALAESFVKEITGNEGKINARHPYGRPFEFKPQAKLIIVGNHAPRLNGRSAAMERRLRVVPFDRRPPVPDPTLKDRLAAEYPAILRWLIDGCLSWQRERLGSTPAIGAASIAYFSDQDSLSEWLAEQCERGADMQHAASPMLDSHNQFLRGRGERPIDSRTFKEAMCRIQGVSAKRSHAGSVFCGVRLRPGANFDPM